MLRLVKSLRKSTYVFPLKVKLRSSLRTKCSSEPFIPRNCLEMKIDLDFTFGFKSQRKEGFGTRKTRQGGKEARKRTSKIGRKEERTTKKKKTRKEEEEERGEEKRKDIK